QCVQPRFGRQRGAQVDPLDGDRDRFTAESVDHGRDLAVGPQPVGGPGTELAAGGDREGDFSHGVTPTSESRAGAQWWERRWWNEGSILPVDPGNLAIGPGSIHPPIGRVPTSTPGEPAGGSVRSPHVRPERETLPESSVGAV